jgi:hypothetical protein
MSANPTLTICTRCRYHANTHDGSRLGPLPDTWFYQVCSAPAVRREPTIDPVTGKSGFLSRNDLGMDVVTDEARPYCRSVNRGDCVYYEEDRS